MSDEKEFWNEIWGEETHDSSGSDEILAEQVANIPPGRALDIGCGAGANAIWLAEHGWQVTAIDFSEKAIERCTRNASQRGVSVDFQVADASAYKPVGEYNLITSFYIHLWSDQRVNMLANAANALAPGGTLLFVSHDRSAPPLGWSDEDKKSLTSPEEIVAELPGLRIEQAGILQYESGSHAAAEGHDHTAEDNEGYISATTLVRAVKP